MIDDETKIRAFDEIAKKFYEHNFGQTSKSDFEVLMFKIYLDNCNKQNKDTCDFTVATALGITESRVRNLKLKKELQYPDNGQVWKKEFIEAIKYAVYDDKTGLVKMSIVEPNVKRNIEHRIDELHIFSEAQLNGKLLQMRPDHFVQLVKSLSEELKVSKFDYDELIKQLKASAKYKEFESKGIIEKICNHENIENFIQDILNATGKVGLKIVLSAIQFEKPFKKFVDVFVDKL